jgi:hypothetical protein
MGWKDTFDKLRDEFTPEEGDPSALFAELDREIQTMEQSHSDAMSGANTRIQELTAAQEERDSEISRLKSVNYDLFVSSGAIGGNDEDKNDDKNTDDDGPKGIASLFGSAES